MSAEQSVAWRKVSGTELRTAFANHELGDGVHYSYAFHADGSFSGYEMAREVRGTWRATAREFCWTWIKPPGAEECFTVERQGTELHFLRDGSELLYGTLKPLAAIKRKGETR